MKQVQHYFPFLLFFTIFFTSAQSQAVSSGPSGPTNITSILEKAGQFTTFTRLLKSTQVADQINTQLKNSNQGLTIFAPTDNAFSTLKSGTLNSLTDQQKVQLVQFHILPSFFSISQFQTASNPLRTQAGDSSNGEFPLNVTTSSGNQVNITTGVVDATLANTIFTNNQFALYQVDKVLLPLDIFGAAASPAPAPSNKPEKRVSGSDAPSGSKDDASVDTSSATATTAMSFGVAVSAAFCCLWF